MSFSRYSKWLEGKHLFTPWYFSSWLREPLSSCSSLTHHLSSFTSLLPSCSSNSQISTVLFALASSSSAACLVSDFAWDLWPGSSLLFYCKAPYTLGWTNPDLGPFLALGDLLISSPGAHGIQWACDPQLSVKTSTVVPVASVYVSMCVLLFLGINPTISFK